MLIKFREDLHLVHKTEHRTPGNKRGFVQAKMRNLRSGSMNRPQVRLGRLRPEGVPDPDRNGVPLRGRRILPFHESETFEQIELSGETLGDQV